MVCRTRPRPLEHRPCASSPDTGGRLLVARPRRRQFRHPRAHRNVCAPGGGWWAHTRRLPAPGMIRSGFGPLKRSEKHDARIPLLCGRARTRDFDPLCAQGLPARDGALHTGRCWPRLISIGHPIVKWSLARGQKSGKSHPKASASPATRHPESLGPRLPAKSRIPGEPASRAHLVIWSFGPSAAA